jgi:hypothetical protein
MHRGGWQGQEARLLRRLKLLPYGQATAPPAAGVAGASPCPTGKRKGFGTESPTRVLSPPYAIPSNRFSVTSPSSGSPAK